MNTNCKECVNCKQVRPRNQFHKQEGAAGWCRNCKSQNKTKACSCCKLVQLASEFHKHGTYRTSRCRTCTAAGRGSKAPWTDANNGVVRALYPEGGAHACQVALPSRSITSINQQASRLGVSYQFTGLAGEQKYLKDCKPKSTPLPFQDTAADHRAWQETKVPAYATGNLGWRIAA